MSDYIIAVDAVFDLEEIWDYIALDSAAAANRWIGKLFAAFDAISSMPSIGHTREDLTDAPVLFWPVGRT